jgi:hypothetical protein
MKKKSFFIIISFVLVCTIFLILPSQLYGDTVTYTDGDFEMKITPGYYNESNKISLKYNGNSQYGSETWVYMSIGYYDPTYQFLYSRDFEINNSFPYEFSMFYNIPELPNLVYHVQVYHMNPPEGGQVIDDWTHDLEFTLTEKPSPSNSSSAKEQESEVWVRDRGMTCYQVWINEDNNFEFVFWWEYKNNNWVKIYDVDGTEVFSIDMKYGNARFEAELPDGMYTVKTFHSNDTPIQEFIIGKP